MFGTRVTRDWGHGWYGLRNNKKASHEEINFGTGQNCQNFGDFKKTFWISVFKIRTKFIQNLHNLLE
jgi:hypothetical protein